MFVIVVRDEARCDVLKRRLLFFVASDVWRGVCMLFEYVCCDVVVVVENGK